MGDPNDNVPVGGGAPPLGPVGSYDADEKALKKGRWRMMTGMIVSVVAAVGALVWFMAPDESESYREFGRTVNRLDGEHFDAFWGCTFQGVDMRDVKTNEDLGAQINKRAKAGTRRYGAYVRERCMPKLAGMEPKLDTLLPPEDLKERIRELNASVGSLRSSWSEFIAYLDTVEEYDEDAAGPQINKIAKGWYDYRRSFSGLNKTLRERIGQ